jgi:phosphatidylinositol glycan class V
MAMGLLRSNSIYYGDFFIYDYIISKTTTTTNIERKSKTLAILIIRLCLLLSTGLIFQFYVQSVFCKSNNKPYCGNLLSIPMIYTYVQSKYWNVGFLNYYTVNWSYSRYYFIWISYAYYSFNRSIFICC